MSTARPMSLAILWLLALPAGAATVGVEFFEQRIRPVLVGECYECHSATKTKGGLRVDYRDGLLKGGEHGPAMVPGDARASLLLQAIRHEHPELRMPKNGAKLSETILNDFADWVNAGAPDPRDQPPAANAVASSTWDAALAVRRQWWSFQPVQKPAVPTPTNAAWSALPVDRFLLAKMEERGLQPAPPADPRVLVRRLHFALTGLPPQPNEVETFVRDFQSDPQRAVEQRADQLLASPRFGERWARHWMDLVRYAESHGSEGDAEIPRAWRYRDYLIRAFNADVPLDQLIREHFAGDLLARPRWNREEDFNESALGIAHWRLVEHGFQPVDVLDDQVKVVENQIDVLGKAFQGLTIACARCHDHKFDPVSQRDYYALYGILTSVRPAQITLDSQESLSRHRNELTALKQQIREALADAWLAAATNWFQNGPTLAGDSATTPWAMALNAANDDANHPLHAWAKLSGLPDAKVAKEWTQLRDRWRADEAAREEFNRANFRTAWTLTKEDDYAAWFRSGPGLPAQPTAPGEFQIEPEGGRVVKGIFPAGVFTPLLSQKHGGLLASPRFKIESDYISVRALGGNFAAVRVILENYPLGINANIFPWAPLRKDEMGWVQLRTAYRRGTMAYLEFATLEDLTRQTGGQMATEEMRTKLGGRSWFGVERVAFHDTNSVPREELLFLDAEAAPHSVAELAVQHHEATLAAIRAWRANTMTAPQAAWLDFFVRRGLVPVTTTELPKVAELVARYRQLEAEVPAARRAPGWVEVESQDAPLMVRGEHTKPGAPVPRGYLQVLGKADFAGTEKAPSRSGRLQLAEAIASADNPLTARVMVNRVWHHLFGRGLVPTVDNFGRLGDQPTHPELLDYLAAQLVADGWSLKRTIRSLVTSHAWQMGSDAPARTREVDPGNELLSHFRVRRLEAEAVRDALLAVSGELDPAMFGPPVPINNAPRRSVYLMVKRNSLSPFLEVFDSPKPFTTFGKRDVTNVPAQSLALLNDPFVIRAAERWASQLLGATSSRDADARVEQMFEMAFARPPSADEAEQANRYLADLAAQHGVEAGKLSGSLEVWRDFAQSLFNLKEFIYLR